MARLGELIPSSAAVSAPNLAAFRDGMREQGYQEGRAYVLEVRHADGRNEHLPALAAERVSLPVDIIVTNSVPATTAARQVTTTIPISMASVGADPVTLGSVDSLARPGGNLTGILNLSQELTAKCMDLLKQTLPGLSRIAMPRDLSNPANRLNVAGAQAAAQTLGLHLQLLDLFSGADLEGAFDAADRQQAEAVLVVGGNLLSNNRARIVDLAAEYRLPALYELREFADVGA